jgi:hypothetical protein
VIYKAAHGSTQFSRVSHHHLAFFATFAEMGSKAGSNRARSPNSLDRRALLFGIVQIDLAIPPLVSVHRPTRVPTRHEL